MKEKMILTIKLTSCHRKSMKIDAPERKIYVESDVRTPGAQFLQKTSKKPSLLSP